MSQHSKAGIRPPAAIRNAPASIPHETITKLRAEVDGLVREKQALEARLVSAREAHQDNVRTLHDKRREEVAHWDEERALMKDEARAITEEMQRYYRVAQLRLQIACGEAEADVLKEREVTRLERIARLQRDYKLTLFQARERDLEDRIAELEDELGEMEDDAVGLKEQHEKALAVVLSRLEQKSTNLKQVQADKSRLDDKYAALLKDHTELRAASANAAAQAERSALQAAGVDDLRRANADLLARVERWERLETRGGAQVDEERQARVKAEVRVTELERKLEDMEEQMEKALEKERRKTERLKERFDSLKNDAEDAKEAAAQQDKDLKAARKEVAKAQKQVEKLAAQLESAPNPSRKASQPPPPVENDYDSTEELYAPAPADEDVPDADQPAIGPSEPAVEPASAPARPKPRPVRKDKGKGKAADTPEPQPGGGRSQSRTAAEPEPAPVPEPTPDPEPAPAKGRKAKRKAVDVELEPERAPAPRKAAAKPKVVAKGKTKAKAAAVPPPESDEEAGAETAPKKKRKINMFAGAQPTSLPWNLEGGEDTLGIPLTLSPVKDARGNPAAVPQRSTSLLGGFGSLLGFGGR